MGRTTTAMVVLVLALVAAQPARADYEAGQKAWDAGSVGEALIQWRAAADAGDRRAMLALGRLYLQGLGVIQDYVEAHKWLNLAASRGEVAALEERDALAAQMTPAQIATAQERAATWRPGAGRADGARETIGAQARATTPPGRPPRIRPRLRPRVRTRVRLPPGRFSRHRSCWARWVTGRVRPTESGAGTRQRHTGRSCETPGCRRRRR